MQSIALVLLYVEYTRESFSFDQVKLQFFEQYQNVFYEYTDGKEQKLKYSIRHNLQQSFWYIRLCHSDSL